MSIGWECWETKHDLNAIFRRRMIRIIVPEFRVAWKPTPERSSLPSGGHQKSPPTNRGDGETLTLHSLHRSFLIDADPRESPAVLSGPLSHSLERSKSDQLEKPATVSYSQ